MLHAILIKRLGSIDVTQNITFFKKNKVAIFNVAVWIYDASKNGCFLAGLNMTLKRLTHLKHCTFKEVYFILAFCRPYY